MKFVKLFAVLFILLSLFSPLNKEVKTASADLPSCGTYTVSRNGTVQNPLKLHDGFDLLITSPDPSLIPGHKYYLVFGFRNLLYIVDDDDTKMEYKNGQLKRNFNGVDKGLPDNNLFYLVDVADADRGNFVQKCSMVIPMVDTSAPTATPTISTCIPGTGNSGNCGSIDTVFGDFSGNPGSLATIFYDFALGIAGGVALIMMIYASFKMISSKGDPDALQGGKQLFTSAVIGLLVIIFAAFIIRIIGSGLGIPGISFHLNTTAYAVNVGGYQINDPAGFKFGSGTLGDVVSAALPIVLFFAGVGAFAFLVFGGAKYMISRGDPKRLDNARSTIAYAILGLVIIVASYVILLVLQAVLKFNITLAVPTAYADLDLGTALGVKFTTFGDLFSSLLVAVLPIGGIIFFFMLLWGGLRYMLSRGDDKAAGAARSIITSAVIGMLIVLGSYIILKVIEGVTGISIIG